MYSLNFFPVFSGLDEDTSSLCSSNIEMLYNPIFNQDFSGESTWYLYIGINALRDGTFEFDANEATISQDYSTLQFNSLWLLQVFVDGTILG